MIRARAFFGLATALFLVGAGHDLWSAWVDRTILPPLSPATSVEVRDRNGSLLRAYTVADGRWRLGIDSATVDADYKALLIAYEDRRFSSHSGVDLIALGRASMQAAWHRRVISGGSTLTMQVARLLEESGTGRVGGKLRQMRVAWALERRMTKDQILDLYLHLAPFGGNIEGVRAASFAWFGKEPTRLTPAQAALLVALPQAPELRRPDRAHARAVTARDRVLARALRDGVLSEDQAKAAMLETVPHLRRAFPSLAPHLADRAKAEDPLALRHDLSLDGGLQRALEQLARDLARGMDERVQIAIVVADHRSGEILASVGSAAFEADRRQGFVDMTQALRSPGSTLKPIVYGLAFDQGIAHPETLIDDRPMSFDGYVPQNFDQMFRGTLRLREALQLSLNLPVVQLLDRLGPTRLLAALDQAGVRAVLPGGQPGLAVALGGVGTSLQDLVQLYAMIARGGVSLPLTHRRNGERAEGRRVLTAAAAWQVADILAGLPPPPGAPPNRLAYKTGTSYGHRDAWAIGFDGRHVLGVWLGRADGTPVPGAFGAETAAPVLFQVLTRLKPQPDPLPPPPGNTLLVATAELPMPLRRFVPRGGLASLDADAPQVAFPPNGAEVELLPDGLLVRIEGGLPPFTWLADGAPIRMAERMRSTLLPLREEGFVTLSVIDARGQSARVQLRLR